MAFHPKEIVSRARWLPRISIICTLIFVIQGEGNAQLPAGQVASHGVERDAVNADGTGVGVGYFTFIAGVPASLFAGTPSEGTAFFTFRSDPFSKEVIPNGARRLDEIRNFSIRKHDSIVGFKMELLRFSFILRDA